MLVKCAITDGSTVICPIFAQARYNILNTRISPYIDFKGGGIVGDFKGGYLEPSVGVSMPVANRFAIDFSFAYTPRRDITAREIWKVSRESEVFLDMTGIPKDVISNNLTDCC